MDSRIAAGLPLDFYEGELLRARTQSSILPVAEFRAHLSHVLAVRLPHDPAKLPPGGD